jgi:hypothetical protein
VFRSVNKRDNGNLPGEAELTVRIVPNKTLDDWRKQWAGAPVEVAIEERQVADRPALGIQIGQPKPGWNSAVGKQLVIQDGSRLVILSASAADQETWSSFAAQIERALESVRFDSSLPAATATPGVQPTAMSQTGRIVFSARSGNGTYIFSVNPDGSDLRQVSPLPRPGEERHLDDDVACSPDGKHIAYSSWRGNSHWIYAMQVDDPRTESLVASGFGGDTASPAWTPDGLNIVYLDGAQNRFCITNLISNHAPLPLTGPNLGDPALSPDGRRLAYVAYEAGRWQLHVANLDGSDDVNLTAGAGSANQPAWSPDGRQIAFYGILGEGNTYEIYVIDADGANLRQLTSPSDSPYERNNWHPSWSPDGKKIAYYSDWNHNGIWLMNADGSGKARITDPLLDASNPCWLPTR